MLRSETFADSIDIQALINDWAAGSTAQAFTQAPHWICLQIPRFEYLAPGTRFFASVGILFPSLIKVPVFVAETSVDMRWDAYSVVAYVQHHGPQPNTGHYTAVLRRDTEHWLYDDEKNPTLLSPAQLEHLSTNMYLVIAVKPSHQAEHSLTPGSAYIPHADEVPRGPLAAVSEPGRLELAHITAVLLYLRRVQIESLAKDMQCIQQALTKYMDKVTIMEGQLQFLRKLAHNKAPLLVYDHPAGSTSFLHRLDD
eukprot:s4306_g7.t1